MKMKRYLLPLVLISPIAAAPGCGNEPELPPVQVSTESAPADATRPGARKVPTKAPMRRPSEK